MNVRLSRLHRMAGLVTACAVLFLSVTASATVMTYLDLGQLVEKSDVIVHGKIVNQETLIDPVRDQVVTRTTVAVDTTYLGEESETVTFQQWGGEWKGVLHRIPGDAQFDPYEEVVLFLHRGEGKFEGIYLTAMSQSKYTVRRDGDQPRIYRDLSDLGFVRDPSALDIEHGDLESNTFASFEAELETLVASLKGGAQ